MTDAPKKEEHYPDIQKDVKALQQSGFAVKRVVRDYDITKKRTPQEFLQQAMPSEVLEYIASQQTQKENTVILPIPKSEQSETKKKWIAAHKPQRAPVSDIQKDSPEKFGNLITTLAARKKEREKRTQIEIQREKTTTKTDQPVKQTTKEKSDESHIPIQHLYKDKSYKRQHILSKLKEVYETDSESIGDSID
jgi:hypothetical protein